MKKLKAGLKLQVQKQALNKLNEWIDDLGLGYF